MESKIGIIYQKGTVTFQTMWKKGLRQALIVQNNFNKNPKRTMTEKTNKKTPKQLSTN